MSSIELLKYQAELTYANLRAAIDGVTEKQAWAVLPNNGSDYIHTDGSIHGLVLHIATCKRIYGSVAFRNSEIRWRDCADDLDKIEPSWEAAVEYLEESHQYWMASWADLADADLEREFLHFRHRMVPAWKLIHTVIDHDTHHGAQISLIRYAIGESDVPPPSSAEDIRNSCKDIPSW